MTGWSIKQSPKPAGGGTCPAAGPSPASADVVSAEQCLTRINFLALESAVDEGLAQA
jgi:hypothetical protein